MITPDYLNEVIEKTEQAVNRLNNQLLRSVVEAIVRAFLKGGNLLIPSTIHDLHKIVQSGYSIDEIEAIIKKNLPGIQNEIHQAFLSSANEIAKYSYDFTKLMVDNIPINVDMPEYTFNNIPTKAADLHMTANEIMTLENAYKRTNYTVRNITQSTVLNVYQDYIQVCDDAYMKVQAGQSPAKAIAASVRELAEKGIMTVQYPSGQRDKIDVAISRAVRTGINQANSEIILTRASEMGVQYVRVSQHLGARVTKHNDFTDHAWWQGKIYSLDWNNPVLAKNVTDIPIDDKEFGFLEKIKRFLKSKKKPQYPDFVETCGYGTIEGIAGINCRHTFQMWHPLASDKIEQIDQEENEKRYKQEQKQRAMERQIRKWKTERDALKQLPPDDEITAMMQDLTEKIKRGVEEYRAYCEKYNLPYYSERLSAY